MNSQDAAYGYSNSGNAYKMTSQINKYEMNIWLHKCILKQTAKCIISKRKSAYNTCGMNCRNIAYEEKNVYSNAENEYINEV
jgi:hypothetical protein